MIDLENIKRKIRALLDKTEQNGCTEAEMFAAMQKARAMMDAYEVSVEDLELKRETAGVFSMGKHDPHDIRAFISIAVARYTETKCWLDRNKELQFCGMPADVQFASWLLDSLSGFVLRELTGHMMGEFFQDKRTRRRAINGFAGGAYSRINARLNELSRAREAARATVSNSRAVTVAKQAVIAATMAPLGLNLRRTTSNRKTERSSFHAGEGAGNRASFGRPVGGSAGGAYLLK